jgi:hypothetical protein
MKMEELIQKAEAKGITLVNGDVYDWVSYAATREQLKIWMDTKDLPNDLTPQEVLQVVDNIFA